MFSKKKSSVTVSKTVFAFFICLSYCKMSGTFWTEPAVLLPASAQRTIEIYDGL